MVLIQKFCLNSPLKTMINDFAFSRVSAKHFNLFARTQNECIMEIKIKSIHFDATEQLHAFIEKKLSKLEKNNDRIVKAEVSLKVVKPETVKNKETSVRVLIPGNELHAEKVCDTFEEGVDLCLEALNKQLEKIKDKRK